MADERSFQEIESEEKLKCPECGSKDIVRGDSEIYCKKCGYVFE